MHWILPSLEEMDAVLASLPKKYHVTLEHEQSDEFIILDDFEHHILRAGSFLTRTNRSEYLLTIEDGSSFRLDSRKSLKFAHSLLASDFQKKLQSMVSVRLVEPVYETRLLKKSLYLRNNDEKVVLKMNLTQNEACTILVLKPIRGYDKSLAQMEKVLLGVSGKSVDGPLSKIVFEYSGITLSDYSVKPLIPIDPSMPARQVVSTISLEMLCLARFNEYGVINKNEDTEYLHDYRICLRKVRSLVNLMKDTFPAEVYEELKSRLGNLSRKTNQLRDLDVYLLDKGKYESMLPGSLQGGVIEMFQDFSRKQVRARRSVKNWIQSDAYKTEMSRVLDLLQSLDDLPEVGSSHERLKVVIAKKAKKRFRKIRTIGMHIHPETPDEEVHELRIECKKFRYLMDFFGALFDAEAVKKLSSRLRKLQNTLGKFNDYSVQQDALNLYVEKGQHTPQLYLSVGALILVLARAQQERRNKVEKQFATFSDDQTILLIHDLFGK